MEKAIADNMATITGNVAWSGDNVDLKTLMLEHHMAALRMGFLGMFDPIDRVDQYKTSFRDGTLAGVRLFSDRVLPLLDAVNANNRFTAMTLLTKIP